MCFVNFRYSEPFLKDSHNIKMTLNKCDKEIWLIQSITFFTVKGIIMVYRLHQTLKLCAKFLMQSFACTANSQKKIVQT